MSLQAGVKTSGLYKVKQAKDHVPSASSYKIVKAYIKNNATTGNNNHSHITYSSCI